MTWTRTHSAQEVLDTIRAQPGGTILLRDLRDTFAVDPSTVQRYVNELVRRGQVRREYLDAPGRPCKLVVVQEATSTGNAATGPSTAPTAAPAMVTCPQCQGTGQEGDLWAPTMCRACEGAGWVNA